MKDEREIKRLMGDDIAWRSVKWAALAIIFFTALGRFVVWWLNI